MSGDVAMMRSAGGRTLQASSLRSPEKNVVAP
jgi:hypothetical protein